MIKENIFQRHEIKYKINRAQQAQILTAMQAHMRPDAFGHSTICNIYYDTPSRYLIRHSLEHPVYKEKLRIRSYGQAAPDSKIYVELKKKYNDVVYKRRISMTERIAMNCLKQHRLITDHSQIADEINYFLKFYPNIEPSVVLSYERDAFYDQEDDNFRVTFDEHILFRQEEFSLCAGVWGTPLLADDEVLMEIKALNAFPLWMCHLLNDMHIRKTSFSKYGAAYQIMNGLSDMDPAARKHKNTAVDLIADGDHGNYAKGVRKYA